MERRDKIRYLSEKLLASSGSGLEIGPGLNAMFQRRKGYDVRFVETRNAEFLRTRALEIGRDPTDVEEIDFVFQRDVTLPDLVGRGLYDWVVSSHVVEHIPDFVQHLADVSTVLKESGTYGMLVPDRNLCFDCLKPVSTLGTVLQEYIERTSRGPLHAQIDELRYGARPEGQLGGWKVSDVPLELVPKYANAMASIRNILQQAPEERKPWFGHQWRFTPASFVSILSDLQALGLTQLRLSAIHPTGHMDFIVCLSSVNSPLPILSRAETQRVLKDYRRQVYKLPPSLDSFAE